jgi:hypothetical protein
MNTDDRSRPPPRRLRILPRRDKNVPPGRTMREAWIAAARRVADEKARRRP